MWGLISVGTAQVAPDSAAWVWSQQGEAKLEEGKIQDAIRLLEKAAPILIHAAAWEALVHNQIVLGTAYYYAEDYAAMEPVLTQSLAVADQHLDSTHWVWMTARQLLTIYYDALGDYEAALQISELALEKALELCRIGNVDTTFLAANYFNVGAGYYAKLDYARAIAYYQQAVRLIEQSLGPDDRTELPWYYANLGVAYQENHEETLAYQCYRRTIELPQTGQELLEGEDQRRAYKGLGIYYRERGEWEQAKKAFERARQVQGEEIGTFKPLSRSLGLTLLEMGEYAEARKEFFAAKQLEIRSFGPIHSRVAQVDYYLAQVDFQEQNYLSAIRHYQQALAHLSPAGLAILHPDSLPQVVDKKTLFDILLGLAETEVKRAQSAASPDLAIADQYYTLLIQLSQYMREGLMSQAAKKDLQAQMKGIFEAAISLKVQLYQQRQDASHLEAAFLLTEQSKAVLLREEMAASQAFQNAHIPDSLLDRVSQLQADLAFYQKKYYEASLKGANADSLKLRTWAQKQFDLQEALDALQQQLEQDYPAYARQKRQTQVPDFQALRNQLWERDAFQVAFFYGQHTVYAFGMAGNGGLQVAQIDPQLLELTLKPFVERLQNPQNANRSQEGFALFIEQAQALYQELIAPFAYQPQARLVLIPDGPLSYLPFELLLTRPSEAGSPVDYASLPYLLHDKAILYAYAASFLLAGKRNDTPAFVLSGFAPVYQLAHLSGSRGMDAVCGDMETQALPQLRNIQPEVRQITALWGGDAFLAREATEGRFKTIAPQSGILHLAMHAFAHECEPLYSRLAFSPDTAGGEDGYLYAYELYQMRIPADLVVLSACETGRGYWQEGEGVMSLTRAFTVAGSHSLAGSLWQADDEATLQLMTAFYQGLKSGLDKDVALQQAKLHYLQTQSRTHPYYWGAFVLSGQPEPIATAGSKAWLWLLLLPLGLLGLFRKKIVGHH